MLTDAAAAAAATNVSFGAKSTLPGVNMPSSIYLRCKPFYRPYIIDEKDEKINYCYSRLKMLIISRIVEKIFLFGSGRIVLTLYFIF